MKKHQKDCKDCKYFHECLYLSIGTFCGFEYFKPKRKHQKTTLTYGSSDEAQIRIKKMM